MRHLVLFVLFSSLVYAADPAWLEPFEREAAIGPSQNWCCVDYANCAARAVIASGEYEGEFIDICIIQDGKHKAHRILYITQPGSNGQVVQVVEYGRTRTFITERSECLHWITSNRSHCSVFSISDALRKLHLRNIFWVKSVPMLPEQIKMKKSPPIIFGVLDPLFIDGTR